MSERTEAPTDKALRRARAQGDVPRATLPAQVLGLLVLLSTVRLSLTALVTAAHDVLAAPHRFDLRGPTVAWLLLATAAGPCAALLVAAVAGTALGGGLQLSPGRLTFDLRRLDPLSSMGRFFDALRLWGLARGALLLAIAAPALVSAAPSLLAAALRASATHTPPFALLWSQLATVQRSLLLAAVPFALLDVLLARQLWLRRHRMSKAEIRREYHDEEGDPGIKRRREELAHELLAEQAIARVREATVVVVNPTHLACVLRYGAGEEETDAAPLLLAKGHDALAARLVQEARRHGVPVVQDVPLAHALFSLDVDEPIPPKLYVAVAEVLRLAWSGEGLDR